MKNIFKMNFKLKVEQGLVLKGWLEKKGKRRWFAVRDGILMWFSTQQTLGSTNSDHASNFVDLKDVYIRVPTGLVFNLKRHLQLEFNLKSEDPTQFLVEHKTEKKKSYYLKAKTKDEALRWVHLLSQTQTQSACLGKVFGKPLTELELADNGIPIVLDRIVNVLIRIGLKTKGIFRLSGASDVIQRMKDELDKDPRSQAVFVSADEDSIHAYASLLKCFLRELPEPLFTFEFYHRILQTSDTEEMAAVVKELPDLNKKVLKFVFQFLRLVMASSEENQMNDSNLAIVFGPNLLKPQVSTLEGGLFDTPVILARVRLLLKDYNYIFPTL
eukprot:TRINITY_DN4526_c0_g1_i2.p1 TRINITY_DN4526_c0_g1~~TRINITY_DN4526_c0_g1_i2.p1  ORF type:complete len:328 (+),score=112.67 TRINITY_DN4526_c0_g1_i2:57-1040(+)